MDVFQQDAQLRLRSSYDTAAFRSRVKLEIPDVKQNVLNTAVLPGVVGKIRRFTN